MGMNIGELFIKIGVDVSGLEKLEQLKTSLGDIVGFSKKINAENLQNIVERFKGLALSMEKLKLKDRVKDFHAMGERFSATSESIETMRNGLTKVGETGAVAVDKLEKSTARNAKTLSSFIGNLNVAKVGVIALTAVMIKMADAAIKSVMGLDSMSRKLGISAQSLEAWRISAKKAGADVDSVFASIKKTQDDLANGRASNVSVWNFLGLDVRRNPEEAMKQLVNKLKNTRDDARSAILQRLGLDENNVNLGDIDLKVGRVGGLAKSPEEIRRVKELNKVFVDLLFSLKAIMERFIAFATPVKYFFELIMRLATGIDNIIRKTIGWKVAATLLSGIVILLLAKLNPLAVKLTALALIADDVITYFEGGNSVLGEFIKWLENSNVVVKILAGAIGILGTVLTTTLVVSKITAWGTAFVSTMGLIKTSFLATNFAIMKTPLGKLLLAVTTGAAIGKWLGDKIGGYGEKHSGEGGWTDKLGDGLMNGLNRVSGWDKNLIPQNSVNHNRTNNNNVNNNITIHSDQPPREIAEKVGAITQNSLNMTRI